MTITNTDFDYLRQFLMDHSAIVLDPGKEYLAESRLAPVARAEGFASLGHLVGQLRTRTFDDLHRKVVDAMTTNETLFFRDAHPFEALERTIIPELLTRGGSAPLSIWCAACSSGQEPYSIAMLLRERFPQLLPRIRILATDLSTAILERARAGRYSQLEVNRGLPATMLVKYFEREGTEWRIREEIRRMVEFQPLNLATPWPYLGRFDVVFLRNVLIYFEDRTKRSVLGRVATVLAKDGVLFLGGAETTLNLDVAFERVALGKAVGYRRR